MLDWLLKNKEWLFSGVGVTAIAAAFSILRYLRNRRSPPAAASTHASLSPALTATTKTLDECTPASIALLSPQAIQAEFRAAPPLQERSLAARYVGQKVDWLTKLTEAHAKEGVVELKLLACEGSMFDVSCTVELAAYRELAVLPRDALVRVAGVITRANAWHAALSDVKLTYVRS